MRIKLSLLLTINCSSQETDQPASTGDPTSFFLQRWPRRDSGSDPLLPPLAPLWLERLSPHQTLTCASPHSGRPTRWRGLPWRRASSSFGISRRSSWGLPRAALPTRVDNWSGDGFCWGSAAAWPLYTAEEVALGHASAHQLSACGADFSASSLGGAVTFWDVGGDVAALPPRPEELSVHSFLQCLRVLLTDVDYTDRWVLADKADQLWVHYSRQAHDVVAAVAGDFSAEDEASVAVLRRQAPWRPVPEQEEVGGGPDRSFPFRAEARCVRGWALLVPPQLRQHGQVLPSPLPVDDRNLASWVVSLPSAPLSQHCLRQCCCCVNALGDNTKAVRYIKA